MKNTRTRKTLELITATTVLFGGTVLNAQENSEQNKTQAVQSQSKVVIFKKKEKININSVFRNEINHKVPKELVEYITKDTKLKKGLYLKEFSLISATEIQDKNIEGWERHIYRITLASKKTNKSKDFFKVLFINTKNGLIATKLLNYKSKTNYGKISRDTKEKLDPNTKIASKLKKYGALSGLYKNDTAHLVAGNRGATHKIAVFSNPMCPHCIKYTPELIEESRRNPNILAIYHYGINFVGDKTSEILNRIHIANEQSESPQDIVLSLYKIGDRVRISRIKDPEKILKMVEAEANVKLLFSPKDLFSDKVTQVINADKKAMQNAKVKKTPTIIVDGEREIDRNIYKKFLKKKTK